MTTSSQDPMYSNLFELNNLTPDDHSHQQALDKIKLTSDRCDRGAKLSTAAHYQYGSIDSNNRWGAGGDQTKQLDETVKARRINLKHGDIKLISIQHRIKYWAFWWLTISLALIWAQLPAELPILSLDAAPAPAPAPFITLSPELLDANQPLYQQQQQQQQVLGGAKSKRAAVDRQQQQQQQQNNNNVEYQEIKPALGDYDKRYDSIDDAINFDANGAFSSSVDDDDDDDLILATDNNLDSELRRRQEINSRYLNEALVSRRKKRQLVQGQESGDKSSLRFNNGSQVNLDDFISVDDLREVIADELKHWLEEQRLRLMDGTRRKLAEKAKSAIAKMTSSSSSSRGKNSLESKPAAWLNVQLIQSDNNDDLTRAQQEEENLSSEATKRYVDNLAKKLYEDNTEHYSEDSQFDKSYEELIASGASTGPTGSSNKQIGLTNSGGGGGGREAVELLLLDNDNNNKEFELEMGPEEDATPEGRLIEERLDEFMPMNDNGNDDTSITSGLDSSIDSTDTANLGNAAQQLWIQRRRLNRDRALEPPAGQRQQPMRRRDADLWQPTTSEAGYFDNNNNNNNNNNQQQQISDASEAQPPTVFINGLSLDQHAGDKTHQQREEDLFLLETMANKLGRNWPFSEEKRHDLGVEMGPVGTPIGEQLRRNSDDLQQVNQYNSEAAATIVNPIIITRPKQEIADEYQQLSSSVEQLAGLDGSLVGSSKYRARADVGLIDEAATKRQSQQQLDNSLEDIDSAGDMARIRTTSFPARKRSMITRYPLVNDGSKKQQPINDEDGPTIRYDTPTNNNNAAMIPMYVNYVNEPSYYEATSDTTTNNNNNNRNKNMERNNNDATTTNWRNPMLDLMSYVGARLTSPQPALAAHLKSQLDGQQQQQQQQQQSKWRRSYQLPATFAVDKIHQYRLAPMLSQQLQYQKNPIDERVTSAANLLEQLKPSNYNPFVSAMASMSSDNNRPTDDRLLFQQQQQQQQIRNAMSEYQRYLEGLNDESEQRRRMSDLLELDLDLPRGTIMDIGLIHRQSMLVKINPIYLSDAKISELTSKYGNILAVVDADGRDVAIMTISRSDLLSSDAMRLANYNMASLGGGGGGGNHQVHPSIMQPFRLLTHSGDNNNKQAAALLEAAAANKQKEQQTTFNDKLGLILLILVVVLAMLPTLLLIRYTMGRHRTYAADMGGSVEDNAHDKSATKASSLFGASNGDYGRHTCCRLRAKCSNFCSYARSAYVGLQGKAYKNLPDENNELTGVDNLATMSGTCKGDASIVDNNQQSCAKCSSPTKDAAPIGHHLDTRRSSSNSSTKSLITGTSQSATINGHQWGNNGADDEPIVTSNMDIIAAHMILSYMEEHLRDKNRLKRDWRELCSYEADLNSTNCALMSENRLKNRSQNAIAYDHSRVKLATTTTQSGSSILTPPGLLKQAQEAELTQQTKYINASYIYDDDPKRATHIITQAPLKETVADFWQMVWEQGCSVIVMLTRLSENGHSLCHCYWPMESRNHQVYGDFEVHLVSEHICCQDYLVRNIYLIDRRSLETRTITQFHYLSWPDKLIPSSINKFLEFRRKVNKCYRISSRPIVVHCNDGAGRSGTYTLIDMVLNRISKGAKEIDIAATLEHLRDQRMGMVNNEIQFEFVLAAVAEEIQAILKALPQ